MKFTSLRKTLDLIEKSISYVIVCLMFVGLIVIGIQVFTRYILSSSTPWSEELSRYINVVSTLALIGLATRSEEHIRMDFFDHALSKKGTIILGLFSLILETIFVIAILISIIKLIPITNKQLLPGLKIPMSVIFIAGGIGIATAVLFCIERIIYKIFLLLNSSESSKKEQLS